ncbi:MAG: hypothetical protein E6G94_14190 [Alphaproteobacteria bacterium]|nr:MAG: hypothetical protein E6G94_14190 [Alphaproteobacteria bacterium]
MRPLMLCLGMAGSIMLAGCATIVPGGRMPGSELVGRSLRVETANGQTSTLNLQPEGRVEAQFGERHVAGLWRAEDERLCFVWGGNFEECWPHDRPFRRGRTETITSSRGNVVRVTLQ